MATLTIHPEYRPLLAAAGLDTFEALFAAAEGRTVDGHRRRGVSRVDMPDGRGGSVAVFVKRQWGEEARPRRADLLRCRRPMVPARREWRNLLRLKRAGIPVAEPVAWGRADEAEPRALVAVRGAAGPSLARWLHEARAAPPAPRLRRAVAEAVGRAVADLHRAGFSMPDLYAKHLYLERLETGSPRVVLIDVQRLRRRTVGRARRDLAALRVSTADLGVTRADRLRVLLAYLGIEKRDHDATHLARAVERKASRMPGRGRDPHLIANRYNAPPGVVPIAAETLTPADDGRLAINEAFRPMLEAAGFVTLEALMAIEGGETYREGFGRSTVRLLLDDPAAGGTRAVYLKRYTRVPMGTKLRRTLSLTEPESFARREVRGILRLAEAGIPSMRPVAFGEALGRGGRDERSCVVTEEVAGATQADESCEARFAGPLSRERTAEKRRLIRQIADLARRLHGADLSHRDFYLCHILVRPVEGREPVLHLIDLQRLTHHRRGIGRRWVVKDLAALLFSSRPGPATGIRSPVFTRADRVRFARAYFQTGRLSAGHKRLLRAVVRKAARIGRHDARKRARQGGET